MASCQPIALNGRILIGCASLFKTRVSIKNL